MTTNGCPAARRPAGRHCCISVIGTAGDRITIRACGFVSHPSQQQLQQLAAPRSGQPAGLGGGGLTPIPPLSPGHLSPHKSIRGGRGACRPVAIPCV